MDNLTPLSIKKFSKFTQVSQSALRYYDKMGLLCPVKRGKNNYRYYEPFQIITLNFINVLVMLGVPLLKIKDLVKKRTPENIVDLLSKQEIELNRTLKQEISKRTRHETDSKHFKNSHVWLDFDFQ